jgi:DNA-binding protein HU-alpha
MVTARKTTGATKTRSTTRKTTTARRKPTPPAAEAETAVTPESHPAETVLESGTVTEADAAVVEDTDLRKKELIEAVVARSGVKKRDAKPAIEAALEILGEALAEGRALNLKPLGKAKVVRMKQLDHGRVVNLRLRQTSAGENTPADPLAQAAE